MNVQTHMTGQVSNQGGIPPQQNGNAHAPTPQMQNLVVSPAPGGPPRNTFNMDPELHHARVFIQDKIFGILLQRQAPPVNDTARMRFKDIAKRLEEGLFKTALTKDEYMNLETLEPRLHNFVKRRNDPRYTQQPINSSPAIGTMIPTPGMSHSGNSNLMVTSSIDTSMIASSGGSSIAPTTVNTGSLMPTGGIHSGSFSRSDGTLSNGYQQSPANFSIGSSGNISSMGVQRMTSQMIPTPGFNINSNNSSSSNNQPHMNLEPSMNGGGFLNVESAMVSQPQPQKQHAGGQNSRILHNLGSQMGSGIRSGMQQKSYGFSNGALNSGMGMIGNNMQLVHESSSSEGYLTATSYATSPKPLQQHFDQHQRPVMQGDGYGMSNTDSFGPGNFYAGVSSAGTVMNTQHMSSVSLQSIPKTSSQMISNQSNLHSMQLATLSKSQLIDQSEKMSFQSSLLQSHHQQQFQQQHHQLNQQQQLVQQHRQQKQQSQQQQHLLNIDAYSQSQIKSDLSSQVKREPGQELQNEIPPSQASEQFQLSDLQNQFQQSSVEDRSRGVQHISIPSIQHDLPSSMSQHTQQLHHLLHPHQSATESHNDICCLSVGAHPESVMQGQWHPHSQDRAHTTGNMSHEQHVQEDFHQRISGQGEAQRNSFSSEGSIIGQIVASRSTSEPLNSSSATYRAASGNRDKQFRDQQRWLLFMRHARRCAAPEGKCQDVNCVTAQKLWRHMERCQLSPCPYPRCHHTKILIRHHKRCHDQGCPVCIPVKNFLQAQLKARTRLNSDPNLLSSIKGSCKSIDSGVPTARLISKTPSVVETSEDLHHSHKRMKIEQFSQSLIPESESAALSAFAVTESHLAQDAQRQDYQHGDISLPMKSEFMEVKMEGSVNSGLASPSISEVKNDNVDDICNQKLNGEPGTYDEPASLAKQENIKFEKDTDPAKQDNVAQPAENVVGTKSGKPKIKGVSLTELFTPEQVREHIIGLRQWVGQSKAKAEKNQAMEHSMSENSCQLCAVEKLTFEPPPIYCSPCGARIKRNAMFYTMGAGDTRHYFCIPCYNEARGENIVIDGTAIQKTRLEKKKNDEETEEWWVQCDKCEAWQHQICALFNGRRNDGGQAEYTCPNCYIAEVERGERKPLPQSAVLGAKDLPRTILSDHIEQRLFRRLKQERQERARIQGKSYDEVPGAESLVVRVVSSVDKKLEVKQRFLEIFQEENYPTEFPYKSKVVLLFQKIEGVEVCLFGMYVQEFGSESAFPNQRRVYLSYLDSVKYFRPEIKAVTGEALRTFVYHEILIGYLEYCRKRGFTSCYIWACPPLKGEDYILYCHPEIQKTPKSDKLREWYLSMLRKAAKENIVVDLTNLYDHFFVTTGECKAKVTAARLPYFDGDYWPGAAEDLIYQLRQEEDGRKQNKKGTTKKAITKRALKASGQSDLSGNASKDLLLMHKLGETISPMKEDFIMVHLQHCCSHCCILIVSGNRWVCNQCKNFQICDKCYEAEQKREERERHPINQREKHTLYPVEITDVPVDTKDKDEILESEFFDTRQAFLSLCQGNHYQYDTLRRAKHSSMMVLYHLHNPTAPAFVTTCNICHLDIETGQGWRCEVCPDYDVCNACYQKDGGIDHPHKLTNHPSVADRDAQNKEARQLRVLQLRKMLDLLVHASVCRSPHCQYPNCRKVKGLFRHGIQCKIRASGGCVLCKKMWYLLQLHARACKESECHVPRCKDLKEHLRRLQQQSDSRRRAAVMEMMRQRAAEVAGNAG
ncbi:ZZ domain-containing protein/PHD domain-containing protein/zf-TAZ domain-containing protein/KAT11 domain-containing protein [Cephalotus follicularis]|uniref:histone acetyltransferase n=1 Tax=Cephalotus follicularis TaxID=3775 RepID=A0A1Q3C287_CEPFO|nr:ZZ domain-containing protein/PHD domain-containing protein/zf-TAZ domain-containing protein/KAT11 domain-containing protein [Cephalotus follicularis]